MAARKIFKDPNGTRFQFDRDSELVEVTDIRGQVSVELMNRNLVQRLRAQGVPDTLWRGSRRAKMPKIRCPFCEDTGQAFGGICICLD